MLNFINKLTYCFLLSFFTVLIGFGTLNSQETKKSADDKFRQKSWRYGLNLGMQSNSGALGWQQLHGTDFNFHSPEDNIDFVDGTGWGTYLGIFGEYLSESWWGVQFRISHDVRSALVIDDTRLPIPSFDTKMSYLTFEPLFRADQKLIPNLNFYAGPFLAVNLSSTFTFKPDESADFSEPEADVAGVSKLTYGVQIGTAYDIHVTDFNKTTSMYISPFAECSWLINQKTSESNPDQNSLDDVWSTVSYRLGVRLSIDNHELVEKLVTMRTPMVSDKVFVALPYNNTILTKNVKGYFPIHPYVFFEKDSKEIPPRYVVLNKSEATNFKEEDLGDFVKGDLTVKETNVNQLMIAYYNVMNVYGGRMVKDDDLELTLIGSDPEEKDGESYAKAVKNYLVTNFGIKDSRIKIVVAPPVKPSGSASTEAESKRMIDDENRRVFFVFNDKEAYRPLVYTIRDESSIDNDMIFSIGKDIEFKSWDVTITGEGRTLYFGPYAYRAERINPAELMKFLESGEYVAKIEITDKNGVKTSESISFDLNKEKEIKNASRYLMIFDYNKSDAVQTYETKIREEIVPGIVTGDRVIVSGHTDIIGTPEGNMLLSQQRADQAKSIIDDQLKKESKSINVQAFGIGMNKTPYTFNNRYPEGRMYNRNIFVEVTK